MSNTQKDKFQFKSKTIYEVTIACDNQHQGLNHDLSFPDRKLRYTQWRKQIWLTITQSLNNISHYYLIPEVSHPQSNHKSFPRLHLHGIIRFKSNKAIMDFLLEKYIKLSQIGILQFNEFRPDHWLKYMFKDRLIWRSYLEKIKQSYEISNVLDIQTIVDWDEDTQEESLKSEILK